MNEKVKVTVEVPQVVDKLVRDLCKIDGTTREVFYTNVLCEGIAGTLNAGELLDLEGVAKRYKLNENLNGLDPSMFGEKESS